MEKEQLQQLAREFATTMYSGEVSFDTARWPEELRDAANAISSRAAKVGISAQEPDGYQVIAIEPHKQSNSFLVCEMSREGMEINLWVRYDERDWACYGPKEDGYWD